MNTKPTTDYGTIPTSTSTSTPTPPSSYLSRATSPRRSWREFLSPTTFSPPSSYPETTSRIRRNLNYFRYNYSLSTLLILFLSLIFHPISMIVFLLIFLLWRFLYFSRDGPVTVLNRGIDDRIVLATLSVVTVVGLVLTDVGVNVLVALLISVFFVGLHAAFRGVGDLFLAEGDDDGIDGSGLVDVVEGQPLRPTHGRVV